MCMALVMYEVIRDQRLSFQQVLAFWYCEHTRLCFDPML